MCSTLPKEHHAEVDATLLTYHIEVNVPMQQLQQCVIQGTRPRNVGGGRLNNILPLGARRELNLSPLTQKVETKTRYMGRSEYCLF